MLLLADTCFAFFYSSSPSGSKDMDIQETDKNNQFQNKRESTVCYIKQVCCY